jgi:hypothetical protein
MVEREAKILKDSASVSEKIRQAAKADPKQKEALALLIATAAYLDRPKDID